MNLDLILIETILWVIAISSAFIAWEFYRSNGRFANLKRLMIRLFIAKIWLYGGSAVYFLFQTPANSILFRIILFNLPMFLVMVPLWMYIRKHNV